jgi:hypothetical protein
MRLSALPEACHEVKHIGGANDFIAGHGTFRCDESNDRDPRFGLEGFDSSYLRAWEHGRGGAPETSQAPLLSGRSAAQRPLGQRSRETQANEQLCREPSKKRPDCPKPFGRWGRSAGLGTSDLPSPPTISAQQTGEAIGATKCPGRLDLAGALGARLDYCALQPLARSLLARPARAHVRRRGRTVAMRSATISGCGICGRYMLVA